MDNGVFKHALFQKVSLVAKLGELYLLRNSISGSQIFVSDYQFHKSLCHCNHKNHKVKALLLYLALLLILMQPEDNRTEQFSPTLISKILNGMLTVELLGLSSVRE